MKKPKEKKLTDKEEKKEEKQVIILKKEEQKTEEKKVAKQDISREIEKINLSKWKNSLSQKEKKDLENIEITSNGSLEQVVGKSSVAKKEEKEDFKYSLGNNYSEKKDNYSSNNSPNYSPSGRVDILNLGKDRRDFVEENVKFNRNSGEFFGFKEEKDYRINSGERFDSTKRKTLFEMEQEKIGEVHSRRDYQ
jgi:hypothetical protein